MDLIARQIPSAHTGELSDGGTTAAVLSLVFSIIATIAVGARFGERVSGYGE